MGQVQEIFAQRTQGLILPSSLAVAAQERRIREAAVQAERLCRAEVDVELQRVRVFFASELDDFGEPDFDHSTTLIEVGRWGDVALSRSDSFGDMAPLSSYANVEELCVQLATARNVARHVFGDRWRKE